MFVTIKLEGNLGTIHSVKVDGEEIIPEYRYNITPHKFVHRGHEGFGLREAVDKIIKNKRDNEEFERKKVQLEKKREEYYDKRMKEETERLNKLTDRYKYKINEINEAPIDNRQKMLGKLYKCSQKNEDLGVTINRYGVLNPIDYPKYPPEYAIPKIKMLCNLHCLKARLRLLCNKYQWHSSLNLVSQQLKLCNIFIFGMAYWSIRMMKNM